MKIQIISAFRNSTSYIDRYCNQMHHLEKGLEDLGHQLHLVLGHGDSKDGTGYALSEKSSSFKNAVVVDVSHGGHYYGSIVHSGRFRDLAYVGNSLWSHLDSDSDLVGLIESDLIWDSEAITELLVALQYGHMAAPMIMHQDGRFYDTWAYRKNGVGFRNDKPYHPSLRPGNRYYMMDSVGSVFLMDGKIGRRLHWPEEDVVVGLCRLVREQGAEIILDAYLNVYHP